MAVDCNSEGNDLCNSDSYQSSPDIPYKRRYSRDTLSVLRDMLWKANTTLPCNSNSLKEIMDRVISIIVLYYYII